MPSVIYSVDINLKSRQLMQSKVQECINLIRKLPEARQLMKEIEKEGTIRFSVSEHSLAKQFKAYWDMDQRVICVSPSSVNSVEELLESMIFEMHNASVSSEIERLDRLAAQREIDRESYIRAIEYLEFVNSKAASAMVEKGVKLAIFPPTTCLETYQDFEEHYRYQKIGGHSQWIGRTYDQLIERYPR